MTPPDDRLSSVNALVTCAVCDTAFRVHPATEEGGAMRDACPACGGPPGVYILDIELPPAEEPAAQLEPTPEPAPAEPTADASPANDGPGEVPPAGVPPEQAADDVPGEAESLAGPSEAGESSAAGSLAGGEGGTNTPIPAGTLEHDGE